MKAKDYFEEKKPNMRELWNLSDTQKELMYSLMEKYAALRQQLVVGRSGQLVCDCGNSSMTWYGNDDDKNGFVSIARKKQTNCLQH